MLLAIGGCGRSPVTVSQPAEMPPSGQFIRVMLLDDIARCQLGFDEPFKIVPLDKAAAPVDVPATPRLTVQFTRGGITFPELGTTLAGPAVDLVPAEGRSIRVGMTKGTRRFRGSLRLVRQAGASGEVVNAIDIEEYLVGVVGAEMPATFQQEALRAQAIASRTYAWYKKQTYGTTHEWDVLATEGSQVYPGADRAESTAAEQAVRDTRGLVCTWAAPQGQRVFCTYFSSTCGGMTQDAGPVRHEPTIPPLAGGVACEYCRHSPAYRWGPVIIDKWYITERLRGRYAGFRSLGEIQSVEVVESSPDGRPLRLAFKDAGGHEMKLETENFRLAVDPTGREIKSTFFKLAAERDAIVLQEGRGWGHGMGMCQYGADGLAATGKRAAEILSFYYPTSRVTRVY